MFWKHFVDTELSKGHRYYIAMGT